MNYEEEVKQIAEITANYSDGERLAFLQGMLAMTQVFETCLELEGNPDGTRNVFTDLKNSIIDASRFI